MTTFSRVITTATQIPTAPNGAQSWTQRTELDGHEYVLTFNWNTRSQAWFFSLADTDETPILDGKKITANTDLLGYVQSPARPQGQLIATEVSGADTDPTLTGWDDGTYALLYLTSVGSDQGAYSSSTAYAFADLVAYNGAQWFSVLDGNEGNEPDASPTWWAKWANGAEVPL